MKKQKLKTINIMTTANFTWIHITKPNKKALAYLDKNFAFHPLDLKDSAPPMQRPKIIDHFNYIFMILLFPHYDKKTKVLTPTEFDFFIGKDYLITIEDSKINTIDNFFLKLQNNLILKKEYFDENPINVLIDIIYKLYNYCFPILNHLNLDTQEIENKLFITQEKYLIKEILRIKNNITSFHKTIRAHKNVIRRLNQYIPNYLLLNNKQTDYLNNLTEYTKDIWDDIDNYKETIASLYETYSALIAYKSNQTMKTLTMVSTILLPLSVIGTIFGMNTLQGMPFVDRPLGFWYILLLMVILTFIFLLIFKLKKWLD
jgi:magnesium transporter